MPADLVAIAAPAALAALAPLAADWRRRRATRRFDALDERNLLRRTGRGQRPQPAAPAGPWHRRPWVAVGGARAGSPHVDQGPGCVLLR
jgi:hypothetical protein